MKNFALTGAAGYVAPRHMNAIRATGNRLLAAVDPHASVGVLDDYFPSVRFFTEVERFDRHLEKLRRHASDQAVHYVSICSPNYLHDAHVRLALRLGATAICEKPLVISPWNLDQLSQIETETHGRVYTIMQLRLLPQLLALKVRLGSEGGRRHHVKLDYITRRGPWYHSSWKGSEQHSGGLAMNIGVHLFDLMLWLFGPCQGVTVHGRARDKMHGTLELERADVTWFLSVDAVDLPASARRQGRAAHRSLSVDGESLEFSSGFADLHTRSYGEILAGRGFGIEEARPAIELIHRVRHTAVSPRPRLAHVV